MTYPDTTTRTYHYEDPVFRHHLTGITDENGVRYATFAYDSWGRATLSEHAGGFDRITLQYNGDASTTVTNAVGVDKIYHFTTISQGVRKPSSVIEAGSTVARTYETGGVFSPRRLTSSSNTAGTTSTYTYDVNHLTSETVAQGTPQERTTSYEYFSPERNLPTKVTTDSVAAGQVREVITTYTSYGGLPQTVTLQGFTPSGTAVSRTISLQMGSLGPSQIDGPRTDVSDITTFEYHSLAVDCDPDENPVPADKCGRLKQVTNALGHITTYDEYDEHARLLRMTDPNGLETAYTYDARGRVLSVTQTPPTGSARVTTYTYDNTGQLKTVSTPDGVTLTYGYNAAHYLTSITDNLGNKIQYGYDLNGNRTDEDVYDPNSVLVRTVDTAYDVRDRVSQINAAGSITDLIFDALGNLTSEQDPLDHTTIHEYDPLNRLVKTIDALSGVTEYDYDVNDNVVQVKAPNGATTAYLYDDLGNLLQEVSPDRGTTTYTYDAAGNRITQTDAKDQVTTYQYDALNRLVSADYDDGQAVTYEYDVGTAEMGRVSRMTDLSGQTEWGYDVFGAVTEKRQTIGTVTLTTSYTHDSGGRVATMTYPSGKVVGYGYTTGQLTSMTVDGQILISSITYEPFGPVSGWTWSSGMPHDRTFDQRGQLVSHSLGTDTRTLTYDLAGRITGIVDSAHDMDYGYDALSRLTSFTSTGNPNLPSSQAFTYDSNGNRLTFSENGGATESYLYQANSNRLLSVSGPVVKSYVYDANGNAIDDGLHAYDYDGRNRLVSVDSGAAIYKHNAIGARVMKEAANDLVFVYDGLGRLLGEYESVGTTAQETVFLGSIPIAIVGSTTIHQVHVDHLGTPRAVTSGSTIVWKWDSDPFGATSPDEDPDGDSTTFVHNFRFPGQFYDAETAFHYNYFRTYDGGIGRYIASDPIGVVGGLNTYSYAGASPTIKFDPFGLTETDVRRLIELIHERTPDIRLHDWEFADLPEGRRAQTTPITGRVLIPSEFNRCLSQNDFEDLAERLLHEGMHASDSIVNRIWDGFRGEDMTANHWSIYRRGDWEMGRSLSPVLPPGKSLADFEGRRNEVYWEADLWGLGIVGQKGSGRNSNSIRPHVLNLYKQLYPGGEDDCACSD